MYRDWTIEQIEARADEVAAVLEKDPKNKVAYRELEALMTAHTDKINEVIY